MQKALFSHRFFWICAGAVFIFALVNAASADPHFRNPYVWIIPSIGVLIAAVALGLNAWQMWRANALTSCSLVMKRMDAYIRDKEMQRAFLRIEYGEFKYTADFHGSNIESETDKLLYNFSMIARMKERGLITLKDVEFAKYQILRICEDEEIQQYFKFINDFARRQGIRHPYQGLQDLARQISMKK